jgi:hypothetical protein
MVRVCPELASAGPRERRQLIALFFELGPRDLDEETRRRTRALFDLERAEDVRVLTRYLDRSGRVPCVAGLQAVFRAHGGAGLLWLLERYTRAEPDRKGRLVVVLSAFDEQEVWRLLIRLLDDRTPVPNEEAAQIAPPGYQHLRVCDYALRALGKKLARVPPEVKLPGDRLSRSIHSTMPIEVRHRRIERVGGFLKRDEEFQAFLLAQPRLIDALPAGARERVREVCQTLGI